MAKFKKIKKFFGVLGPGMVTGIADDDPSGIATYSQTGAQFGFGQLWTALFMLPLMIAIQEACVRIGAVKGKGLAGVIKTHYSKKILYPVVFLLLIANIINIGADIGAMAAATKLIVPINFTFLILLFTLIILMLQIFLSYRKYANVLKWLAFCFIVYPLSIFIINAPWLTILKTSLIPHIEFNFQFLFIITGLLGTTISPYLFFWQPSQQVEEEYYNHTIDHNGKPNFNKKMLLKLRIDNFIGMFFSQLCAWSIIVVTATILHGHGISDIKTAADAAKALEPLVQSFPNAGLIAKIIFAFGIIGLGFLSVPVLAGSAAYSICETFNIRSGLNLKFKTAYGFYGIIIAATVVGLLINFIGVDPIKLLIYAAVINGIVAIPLIFIINSIAKNQKIMGHYKSGTLSTTFVWITFFAMLGAALAMILSLIIL